jgi:hypothetical protein
MTTYAHTMGTILHPPTYLVIPEPYPVVCYVEGEHMVTEGLALVVALGCGVNLNEQLLQELQVGLLVKSLRSNTNQRMV